MSKSKPLSVKLKQINEFHRLNKKLNVEMWKIAGKLPDGLENCLSIMEQMLRNINKRI